jgi:hypothetical protein
MLQFRDSFGNVVGKCSEKVKIKDGMDCSPRILKMRYEGNPWVSV